MAPEPGPHAKQVGLDELPGLMSIRWMVDAVIDGYVRNGMRIDAFEQPTLYPY